MVFQVGRKYKIFLFFSIHNYVVILFGLFVCVVVVISAVDSKLLLEFGGPSNLLDVVLKVGTRSFM